MTISRNVKQIEEWGLAGQRINEIIVEEDNKDFTIENGILYNKQKTIILKVPCLQHGKEIHLLETIKVIDPYCFSDYDYYNESSIHLPNQLEKISDRALFGCTSDIVIP